MDFDVSATVHFDWSHFKQDDEGCFMLTLPEIRKLGESLVELAAALEAYGAELVREMTE